MKVLEDPNARGITVAKSNGERQVQRCQDTDTN